MSKTTIYYFSATGNSFAVARDLAQMLDVGDPVSVPGSLVNKDPYIHARGATAVGFVFPVQRATIPEMLRGFILSLPVDPNCYYFAVSTYSLFGSNEFWDIDELLASKGAALNYAAGIRMMGNVGITQPSQNTMSRRIDSMKRTLDEIATAVTYRQESFFPRSNKLLGKAVRVFTNVRRKNIVFNIDKHCRGCGICAQVCPAQNILIFESNSGVVAPIRSDKCEACLACVHWCPAAAISTQGRLHQRYHNPTVHPEELSPERSKAQASSLGIDRDKTRLESTEPNAELAQTLRDNLLKPADIDIWLNRREENVDFSSRSSEPYELGEQTMSVADIDNALADLER